MNDPWSGQGAGGYVGPSTSGGEAPLGRIPFSAEDEKNIRQTAVFMRAAGGLAILGALLSVVGWVAVGLFLAGC